MTYRPKIIRMNDPRQFKILSNQRELYADPEKEALVIAYLLYGGVCGRTEDRFIKKLVKTMLKIDPCVFNHKAESLVTYYMAKAIQKMAMEEMEQNE